MLNISAAANINIQDKNGFTALHRTALLNNEKTDVAALLIKASVDLNIQDNNEKTTLQYAISLKHLNTAALLLIHKSLQNEEISTSEHRGLSISTSNDVQNPLTYENFENAYKSLIYAANIDCTTIYQTRASCITTYMMLVLECDTHIIEALMHGEGYIAPTPEYFKTIKQAAASMPEVERKAYMKVEAEKLVNLCNERYNINIALGI